MFKFELRGVKLFYVVNDKRQKAVTVSDFVTQKQQQDWLSDSQVMAVESYRNKNVSLLKFRTLSQARQFARKFNFRTHIYKKKMLGQDKEI